MSRPKKNSRSKRNPSSRDQINRHIGEMLQRHVAIASEFVSSITVVCTKLEADGSTTNFTAGSGDRNARINAVHEWLDIVS